jgi:hypothetical protein
MMWSITTCRTLYVNVAPNYRSEGRACQVRGATLDHPLRFSGHDKHAPPQSDKTGARRSSSPLADRIKGVN